MIRKSIFLLLCLGWLSACERVPEQPEPAQAPLVTPVQAPAAGIAKAEPVEPTPPTKATEASPVAPGKPQAAARPKPAASPLNPEPESKLALDLSVPQELFEQALESETHDELLPLLPPLFGDKPEVISPFQLSGRLISNDQVNDYWESIEGAELQFEFRQ